MLEAFVKRGIVIAEEVPAPKVSKGSVLIKVLYSCISTGTELHSLNESGKTIAERVIAQPEKISKGLKIIAEKGVKGFYRELKSVTDGITPIGYSLSGTVIEVGEGVTEFSPGEKVAAAGGGYATHSEYANVPVNLVIKVDQNIDLEYASTVALGGIALQGIRRAGILLGEYALVFGCGPLGLLTIQLLRKSGVRVIAADIDDSRLKLALKLGAIHVYNTINSNYESEIITLTGGHGVDAVLFTASTDSSEPLSKSFKVCKKKGKVVLVGVSGMNILREDIYSKELDFLISTSYGPGRYDKSYEEEGIDYPYGYVRWTEKRNMEEYLKLVAEKSIILDEIINGVFEIKDVSNAYNFLKSAQPRPLLALLKYDGSDNPKRYVILNKDLPNSDKIQVAIIGAGSFALSSHIPNMAKLVDKFELNTLMDLTGSKAYDIASQYNFKKAVTDYDEILSDPNIDLIVITTRHDSHFDYLYRGLLAGKNIFVEKPMCTKTDELNNLKKLYEENQQIANQLLFVGYNRRFSPYLTEIKRHTNKRVNPLFITYRMNGGFVPLDSWVHKHGGRIVGEACHIIDIFNYLTESKALSINVESLTPSNGKLSTSDNKTITIKYTDGSVCTLHYFAAGSTKLEKEYMEIHFDGKSIVMNDYKSLKGYDIKLNTVATKTSEKGHFEELYYVHKYLTSQSIKPPIELWDLFQTSEISLKVQ